MRFPFLPFFLPEAFSLGFFRSMLVLALGGGFSFGNGGLSGTFGNGTSSGGGGDGNDPLFTGIFGGGSGGSGGAPFLGSDDDCRSIGGGIDGIEPCGEALGGLERIEVGGLAFGGGSFGAGGIILSDAAFFEAA